MIAIATYLIKDQNLKTNLEWVGDLVYIDEPILSLFKDKRNNNLYLFDWVDSDNITNRWLVYRINQYTLYEFINKNISLKDILDNIKTFFVTDIKYKENAPFDIQGLEKLPFGYTPDTDLLFDESDTRDLDKIKSVLEDLSKNENHKTALFNLSELSIVYPNKYRNYKAYHFSLDIFETPLPTNDIKNKIPSSTLPRQNEIKPNRVLHEV